MVENLNANHAVLLLDKRKHLVIHKDFRPMGFCVDNVGESEAERIDRAIRHFHRSDNRRIDRRLHALSQLRIDDFGVDASLLARLNKRCLICQVVFRQGDEQAVVLLHAVACHLAQNHVFLDALRSRLLVGHRIAGAAVKQSVVAACGSRSEIETLQQQNTQATQRAVARRAGSCCSSSYDYYVIFVFFIYHVSLN